MIPYLCSVSFLVEEPATDTEQRGPLVLWQEHTLRLLRGTLITPGGVEGTLEDTWLQGATEMSPPVAQDARGILSPCQAPAPRPETSRKRGERGLQ